MYSVFVRFISVLPFLLFHVLVAWNFPTNVYEFLSYLVITVTRYEEELWYVFLCVCSPDRQTSPGPQPASLFSGTRDSFPCVKAPVRKDRSPLPRAEIMNAWTDISTPICLHCVMPCLPGGQCGLTFVLKNIILSDYCPLQLPVSLFTVLT
jgi:hypothetical protein